MPVMQEASIPIIKFKVITDEFEITPGSLTMAAPKMMGVDSRNENLAAPSLVTPISSPCGYRDTRTGNSQNNGQGLGYPNEYTRSKSNMVYLNLLGTSAICPIQKDTHPYQHHGDEERGSEYGFGLFF
jgi:hypothetical protein